MTSYCFWEEGRRRPVTGYAAVSSYALATPPLTVHPKTVALFVTNCLQLFTDADIKIHSAGDLEPSEIFCFVF